MIELQNLAKYRRCLLGKTNLLVVRGNITPVIAGMGVYNSRYKIDPPEANLEPAIKELLSGAALSAVSLADRESWGWSLTFAGMQAGFFIGVEPEGMICLRVLSASEYKASGMVQRQKAGLSMTQSHVEPRTANPGEVVEQYFNEVIQTKTRVMMRENGEGLLVQSLPGGNFDAVKDLDAERLFSFVNDGIASGEAVEAGEVLVFYECRCSGKMISGMVESMSESDRKELFAGSRQIRIECPRCGREYTVTRTEKTVH